MNVHAMKDVAFDVMIGCSVAHSLLPPWDADAIAQFPTLQKYYKLVIYLLGYVALNARSTVYRSISTSEGSKVSDITTKTQGATPNV